MTGPGPGPDPVPPSRAGLVTCGAVALGLIGAAYAAWQQDWTYDEPVHLLWSQRLLETGVTERDSVERFDSKTPIVLPNVLARQAAASLGVEEGRAQRFLARLPTLLWLGAALATTFLLARWLFGGSAAHLATTAVALDPNLIAHGSLATVDTAYAAATLLTLGAGLLFLRRPSLARGALMGLALGLAFAAKFTAVLLLAGLLLLPLALDRRPALSWRSGRVVLAGALLAAVAAVVVVCSAYLFRDVGVPMSSLTWKSSLMTKAAETPPNLRLPLPGGFLTGLDRSIASERGEWNVYLLGRRHPHGVWYYFAVLWLLKTPLLLLLAQIAGLTRAAWTRFLLADPAARYLAANLLLTLAYFSLVFHTQKGYRFVLMCVPLAYILAAAALAPLLRSKGARLAAAGVFLVTLLENTMYVGNPLAFTSAAVWPKREAFRLIADSNIDWGQNRDKIRAWLAESGAPPTHLDPVHILPGRTTIGLNVLAGIWDFEQHRWLRENASPSGHFGHTYLTFDVDEALYERFLGERRRLVPTPTTAAICGSDLPSEQQGPGSQTPFAVSGAPDPKRLWIVCVSTRRGADFGLRSLKGRMRFGPYGGGPPCEGEMVDEGQVAWYRLEPGVHALCAAEVPHRRAWLAHEFRGWWLVRRRGASVSVREVRVAGAAAVPEPRRE